MGQTSDVTIQYQTHNRVKRLCDVVYYHLESISIAFDRWEEPYVFGPGLYVAIVVGPSLESYADPMGDNRWPADAPQDVLASEDGFTDAMDEVAFDRDGAMIISVDGIVSRQFVRFRSVDTPGAIEYADWMGSRHMSALDISTRPDVIATMTLSQESGRVTRFEAGSYRSVERSDLGGRWRTRQSE